MSNRLSFLQKISSFFKGYQNTKEEDFIYFWDDVKEIERPKEIKEKRRSFNQYLIDNQVLIIHEVIGIIAVLGVVLMFLNQQFFALLDGALLIIVLIFSYLTVNRIYTEPFKQINQDLDAFQNLDFSISNYYSASLSESELLSKLENSRKKISSKISKLDLQFDNIKRESSSITDRFFKMDDRLSFINLNLDQSITNETQYQRIRGHTTVTSDGIDQLIGHFDNILLTIREVTNLVKSIGRQSTMLALNAGIEAARAGEFGIGFEVVAENLRRLSQHAISSGNEINEKIKEIEIGARDAIDTITFNMNSLDHDIIESHDSGLKVQNSIYKISDELNNLQSYTDRIQSLINESISDLNNFKS